MSYNPTVSVVIPTYNRAQPTIRAIQSVLVQTYKPYEVFVIDDGSTDSSDKTVQQFVQQRKASGDNVSWIQQANQGPSAARNEGIRKRPGASSSHFWIRMTPGTARNWNGRSRHWTNCEVIAEPAARILAIPTMTGWT